jgi:uncharacterized protein (DUF1499 family)
VVLDPAQIFGHHLRVDRQGIETMKISLLILVLLLAAGLAWVRLAPSDPARWHTDPAQGAEGPGSHVAKVFVALQPAEALAALDAVALAEPRTIRLAGSPAEGRITWISRTKWIGFPDYITAAAVPGDGGSWLLIHARLRFGASDLGVNAARTARWTAALPAP